MLRSVLTALRSQYLGALALFVVLAGGTSYAATKLAAGSVGTRQLKNHAVTNSKLAKHSVGAADLDRKSIAGYVRDWAQINPDGTIAASRPRAHTVVWTDPPGTDSSGGGLISWNQAIPNSRFALATTTPASGLKSYASADVVGAQKKADAGVQIVLSAVPSAVNVAVICPGP